MVCLLCGGNLKQKNKENPEWPSCLLVGGIRVLFAGGMQAWGVNQSLQRTRRQWLHSNLSPWLRYSFILSLPLSPHRSRSLFSGCLCRVEAISCQA